MLAFLGVLGLPISMLSSFWCFFILFCMVSPILVSPISLCWCFSFLICLFVHFLCFRTLNWYLGVFFRPCTASSWDLNLFRNCFMRRQIDSLLRVLASSLFAFNISSGGFASMSCKIHCMVVILALSCTTLVASLSWGSVGKCTDITTLSAGTCWETVNSWCQIPLVVLLLDQL